MKEIVIVSKGNNAVAYGEGVEIKKTSTTGVSANLLALNEVLKTVVPTEAGETHRIFLMDLVQGINAGYAIDYVKTGKQMNGEPLNEADLAGYKEFYELYKDRLLNVRFNLVSYIPKMRDNKVYMDLRSKAYAILNSMPTANTVAPTQTVIDPDKELRETFDKLIKDALTSGNMELYRELKVERDKLQAPQVSSTTTTNAGNQMPAPTFDVKNGGSIDDIDFTMNSVKTDTTATTEETNDKPIEFEIGSTPTWDSTQA